MTVFTKNCTDFFFIPIAPIKGNDSQSPKPCKPWLKRYIEERMVLCMNFYVKVWKIDGDHQIGKYCTQACMYVLVSLSMCVQSVSQISLKAHDETKRLKNDTII